MRSRLISHRKPFKVDRESIATNARMSWMKCYFCTDIPGHWQPGLLTKNIKLVLFLNKVKTFKMFSDHSEFDSLMKIRLYPRLISLVLFWTASSRPGDVQGDAAVSETVNMAGSTQRCSGISQMTGHLSSFPVANILGVTIVWFSR